MVPLLLEPILLKLECGRYVGPLLPDTLVEIFSGIYGGGRSGGSNRGGGSSKNGSRGGVNGGGSGGGGSGGGGISGSDRNGVRGGGAGHGGAGVGTGGAGGATRVQVCYEGHLTSLYLWDRGNARTIMVGIVLPTGPGSRSLK